MTRRITPSREQQRQRPRSVLRRVAPGDLQQRRRAGSSQAVSICSASESPPVVVQPVSTAGPHRLAARDPGRVVQARERLLRDAVLGADARLAMAEHDERAVAVAPGRCSGSSAAAARSQTTVSRGWSRSSEAGQRGVTGSSSIARSAGALAPPVTSRTSSRAPRSSVPSPTVSARAARAPRRRTRRGVWRRHGARSTTRTPVGQRSAARRTRRARRGRARAPRGRSAPHPAGAGGARPRRPGPPPRRRAGAAPRTATRAARACSVAAKLRSSSGPSPAYSSSWNTVALLGAEGVPGGVRAQRRVHALRRAAGRQQQPQPRPRAQPVGHQLGAEHADAAGVVEHERARRRHAPILAALRVVRDDDGGAGEAPGAQVGERLVRAPRAGSCDRASRPAPAAPARGTPRRRRA